MRPDERELDDEIRGHLAISMQERLDRGEDPATARQNALAELGYVGGVRESMRRVWYSRWFDAAAALGRDVRIAFRSLRRAKGLAATVVVTLGLGIGANAAIFSVVRGVLLRPLVNRDEDRLVYIRQAAPGTGTDNMTFSVPEVNDLKARVRTISAFGDFSTVSFTIFGLGPEPRVVKAGVVGGSYFEVMGLRPVLGRLLTPADDGPKAAGVFVLTYRFWTTALGSDPSVVGKTVRLGQSPATIVGILEPSVPYPAETEIIANVVSSPHHLTATMVTSRIHRMTELFGRLAPGATLDEARAEMSTVHAAMMRAHPDAYSPRSHVQVGVTRLRDQIASPARTILLVLLAAAAVVFVIACSNVANLILARSVRREGELTIRAALGAGRSALRRTLLAESLVLCGAGALFGLAIARPSVGLVARYAARFSVRALDLTVDPSVLWVSFGLAIAAAVLLAYIPRLPSAHSSSGVGLASGGRLTPSTSRRLRTFAVAQIAFSFVLLAGAGMLVATLVSLQTAKTVFDTRHLLVFDIPPSTTAIADAGTLDFYREVTRRVSQLPSVAGVAVGSFVPWRDADESLRFEVSAAGYKPRDGEPDPHASFRIVAPNYFAVLGVPILAGRDFTDADRARKELVCIASESIVRKMFDGRVPLNRELDWKHPITGAPIPARIVGVAADVDDESVTGAPPMTLYFPVEQFGLAGRLFVHVNGDPYALIPAVRTIVRRLSSEQPVERAATLEDVRAQVLSPARVNAFVVSGFAGIALLIAVVGIAGVLAFSVSARTREFGVRLAVGSAPRHLLARVLSEGLSIAAAGVAAGVIGGFVLVRVSVNVFDHVELPGALTTTGAALLLIAAAGVAALLPAARAARIDVIQALRSE
jgi:putative ABC transport system permease protein